MALFFRLVRTIPADARAVVGAYPRIVVWFAAALTGTALVFDVFYLVASPGLAMALVYTVPVLAGLVGGLVAAADDVGLERPVLIWTVVTTVAIGITNALLVAMAAAMGRTGPGDWASGGQAVLFAAIGALALATTSVVAGKLMQVLGVDLQSRRPHGRAAVPAPLVRAEPTGSVAGRPVASTSAYEEQPSVERPYEEPGYEPDDDEPPYEPVFGLVPRVVDLDGPREILPADGSGHADRRAPVRRVVTPSSRRSPRPGRRPDR